MDTTGIRVALLGEGPDAKRWAATLRRSAKVEWSPHDLPENADAAVLAPGTSDPFAQTKEALKAGVPVLYAAPFLLSPWQAAILSDLSRRQKRLLRFVEPFQHRQGFAFLRRLLEGTEPFWRPLYVRTLRLAESGAPASIDELATEEIAICTSLLDGAPEHVTAAAGRRNDIGEVCAAFILIHYSDGPVVQCTISLAEATSAHQLVAVTPDRTVTMNELDPTAPLRITSTAESEVCGGEHTIARPWENRRELDPVAEEAESFLGAIAAGDVSSANGERWTRVAGLWWAARQSMSFGGMIEVPTPPSGPEDTEPPHLRVIEGGGNTSQAASRRPPLKVIAR